MATLNDITARILGDVLGSTSLYADDASPGYVDLGDEFPHPNQPWQPTRKSPLMADVPGADTTNWSSDPRPTVTAWRGADMNAYYFDADRGVWLHCLDGTEWTP